MQDDFLVELERDSLMGGKVGDGEPWAGHPNSLDVWLPSITCLRRGLKHQKACKTKWEALIKAQVGGPLGNQTAVLARCQTCRGREGELVFCSALSALSGPSASSLEECLLRSEEQ